MIPGTITNWLPIAVAPNQRPIIKPAYLGGATFDTNEIPIGESRSSAKVRMRYVEIRRFALTRVPSVAGLPCVNGSSSPIEPTAIHTKANAATSIPRPIFSGDVGSLPILRSQANNATLTGVNATT